MIDRYAEAFPGLTFSNPADGVLQITLEGPGLNSVDAAKHRQIADVWAVIDRDREVNAPEPTLWSGSGSPGKSPKAKTGGAAAAGGGESLLANPMVWVIGLAVAVSIVLIALIIVLLAT